MSIDEATLTKEANALLRKEISAMVSVSELYFVPGLPKTRSGKILRRILRTLARSEPFYGRYINARKPRYRRLNQVYLGLFSLETLALLTHKNQHEYQENDDKNHNNQLE